ncbi:MAG: hypothetical protein CMJ72_06935 [Planctomycetaceae bacterium]|nr:hypothetical protein [Planctomycetaceae bacterium]
MYRIFPILTALIFFSACNNDPGADLPPIDNLSTLASSPTPASTRTTHTTGQQAGFVPWGTNAESGALISATMLVRMAPLTYREEICEVTKADSQGRWFFNLDSGCFKNGDLVRFVEHTGRWGTARYAAAQGTEIVLGETTVALWDEQDWITSINWQKPVFVAWGRDAPPDTEIIVRHSSYGSTEPTYVNKRGEWLHVLQFEDACPPIGPAKKHHPCHAYAVQTEILFDPETGGRLHGSHATYLPGENAEMFFDPKASHAKPSFVDIHWKEFVGPADDFFVSKMRPYPFPGADYTNAKVGPFLAHTYTDCSHTSALLGPSVAPVTDISQRMIGFGTGPCTGWFVMDSNEDDVSDISPAHVWIPGTSVMQIPPDTPAHEVMNLPIEKETWGVRLLPLEACDPVGFWQANFYYGSFGFQNPMAKMEFHDDLSQILDGDWIEDFVDISEYTEGDFWRGGFDVGNRTGAPLTYHQPGWIDHHPDGAFVWRYVSPDKTPTREPNYGIQIIGPNEHFTVYAELSSDCTGMRGETHSSTGTYAGSFWAGRMDASAQERLIPTSGGKLWPTTFSRNQMFMKACQQAIPGTWVGDIEEQYGAGTRVQEYTYLRVFLPDGYGYERLLLGDSSNYGYVGGDILPPAPTIPFWWAIDRDLDLLLVKEFSMARLRTDGTSGVDTSSLNVDEWYSLGGCHSLYGEESFSQLKGPTGELLTMRILGNSGWYPKAD